MRAIVFDEPGDESRCLMRHMPDVDVSRHRLASDEQGLDAGVLHMKNIPPPHLGPHDIRIRCVTAVAVHLLWTSEA